MCIEQSNIALRWTRSPKSQSYMHEHWKDRASPSRESCTLVHFLVSFWKPQMTEYYKMLSLWSYLSPCRCWWWHYGCCMATTREKTELHLSDGCHQTKEGKICAHLARPQDSTFTCIIHCICTKTLQFPRKSMHFKFWTKLQLEERAKFTDEMWVHENEHQLRAMSHDDAPKHYNHLTSALEDQVPSRVSPSFKPFKCRREAKKPWTPT